MFLLDVFRKLKPYLWLIPGFLMYAAFPPMAEKMDILFALAPLLWLSRQGNLKTSAWQWFLNGFIFWFATLSWMPAIVKNGGPWPLVVLGWGALAAYCAAFFAAFGWLSAAYWKFTGSESRSTVVEFQDCKSQIAKLFHRFPVFHVIRFIVHSHIFSRLLLHSHIFSRLLGIFIVEPVLWCGLELLRSRLFGGFAWNQLGVVPANAGFGGPAAVGGVYLLSAVVVLINGSIAGIAERMLAAAKRERVSRWRSLETVAAFALVWAIYAGAEKFLNEFESTNRRIDESTNSFAPTAEDNKRTTTSSTTAVQPSTSDLQPDLQPSTSFLKVALVQRNFPCVFQRQEENPYEVYAKLVENVAELKPDLVVLAESAMCEFGPVEQQGAVRFAKWLSEKCGGAAVLAGGSRYGEDQIFNSAALYTFDHHCPPPPTYSTSVSVYDKVHLVPFGEFIPGDKWFPVLQKLAPVGSCTPGEPKLLSLLSTSLGLAICFEDTDSALMRRYAAMGAQALVFITNDSWFSHSIEAEQHAWQAVLRAIETGLPVVRVGNSGVTGTITPEGRCSWLTGPDGRPLVDRRAAMFDRIPLKKPSSPTPYVHFGDWPLGCFFALLILAYILVYYWTNHEQRRYLSL